MWRLLILLAFSINVLFSQQLPNMDFEDWAYDPLAKGYIKLNGFWDTGNSCYPDYPPGGGDPDTICYIFVTKQSDAFSGKSSIKIQTPTSSAAGSGFLSTYSLNNDPYVPFEYIPIGLKVYYKYFKGQATDEASIVVNLYDDNLATNKYGVKSIFKESNAWSPLIVDLSDIPPTNNPKFVELNVVHAQNLTTTPSYNTYLMLDNMSFIYASQAVHDEAIKDGFIFQEGVINISSMKDVENMEIYSILGQRSAAFKASFDTKTLRNGIYIISYQKSGYLKTFKLAINN